MVNPDFLSHFENLELFRDLPREDLEKFLRECREEVFAISSVIFREGDEPDRFYVLLEGQVEIWKDYDTPHADVLAVRGPGACFGEMSLIDELPRSATVTTTSVVRLVSLEKPHFRRIIEENPPVAMMIMRTVSKMVRVSNETFQYGLRQKNLMLEKAYDELTAAQASLIRSERLSTLGKFASMIIHDLRNPISIVKGYSELLMLGANSPEKTAAMAAKLVNEADRLNRMVGELLDYSRGNIRLDLSAVFLKDLFARLEEQFQAVFQSKQISWTAVIGMTDPLLLDHDRILRVFTNVIDNARKAMRHGGCLKIVADADGEEVVIRVSDTGEGMPEEVRKHLFEPFFSASKAGGSGLGMVVVANVIEAHHGTVTVESKPDIGTTIIVRLPLHARSFA